MKYSVFSSMLLGPRANQEDCILDGIDLFQADRLKETKVIKTDHLLLCICDGMGGHDHGEIASQFVCSTIKEKFEHKPFGDKTLKLTISEIQASAQKELPVNCGTTVAGLISTNNHATIFNAGDSRVYRISESEMGYISHDHSLVQGLIDKLFIQQDSAVHHPLKNVIDFGMGPLFADSWGNFNIHMHKEPIENDVSYLLCSDGLSDVLSDQEMHEILMPSPVENGENLVNAAIEKGLTDNTSFVILKVHPQE